MMVSTTDILNLLRARPGRFIEDIAGDEFPMREGEPPRVCRRLFRLSHAAMAVSSSVA